MCAAGFQAALGGALLHGAPLCLELGAATDWAVSHSALAVGGGLCSQLLCHLGASMAHRVQVGVRLLDTA